MNLALNIKYIHVPTTYLHDKYNIGYYPNYNLPETVKKKN